MKKAMLVVLVVLVAAAVAMAQTYYTKGSGITGVDKLGAHQNGGRGCTGCHAPHSGAFGAGGNAITGTSHWTRPMPVTTLCGARTLVRCMATA